MFFDKEKRKISSLKVMESYQQFENVLSNTYDFSLSKRIVGYGQFNSADYCWSNKVKLTDDMSGIVGLWIDYNNKRFCVRTTSNVETLRIFKFSDIQNFETTNWRPKWLASDVRISIITRNGPEAIEFSFWDKFHCPKEIFNQLKNLLKNEFKDSPEEAVKLIYDEIQYMMNQI